MILWPINSLLEIYQWILKKKKLMIYFTSKYLYIVLIKNIILFNSFLRYGRIRDIDLKTPSRPPAYAFITYDDVRDAEDAIRARYYFLKHLI